ncbi:hypothetical protein L4D20_00575 [Vibrio kyushuensis]|uniref:hypothetical protein n=1 Tax=Vibrio kyushuensis TaxID=2910249 RepID=UPI003D0EFF56
MLTTSVASSAPMMTFKMLDHDLQLQSNISPCHSQISADDSRHQQHSLTKRDSMQTLSDTMSSSPHCESNNESAHTCCSATCATVVVFTPNVTTPLLFDHKKSLFSSLSQGNRVLRPQSLYRPPIA